MKLLIISVQLWCLVSVASSKKATKKTEQKSKFLLGRIPPGCFEYPELNGYFSPKEAIKICESDTSCGGFTFKGVTNSPKKEFDTYFFHFVPKELFEKEFSQNQSFHWTSYIVQNRNFTELKNYKFKNTGNKEPVICLKDR